MSTARGQIRKNNYSAKGKAQSPKACAVFHAIGIHWMLSQPGCPGGGSKNNPHDALADGRCGEQVQREFDIPQ